MDFDWHGAPISRATLVDASYRSTQGDVVDEWRRRSVGPG